MDALAEMIRHTEEMNTQKNSGECSTRNSCPLCHGTGWILRPDGGQGVASSCRCRDKEIMRGRISFANIPDAFADTRLAGFRTDLYQNQRMAETAVKAVKYWLDNFDDMNERGMGVYLHSETKGSGKTRMAVSIANELIHEKGIQVKFATSLKIINEIKASWGDNERKYTESRLLHFLETTKVLIIDDFGTEQARDWIGEKFYQIINSRYVDKKITIFTSNVALNSLQYDDRITNRIKERTFQIPFPEESIRDMIAKQNMRELIGAIKDRR